MSYEQHAESLFVRRLREAWDAMIALYSVRLAYLSERHVKYRKAHSVVVEHVVPSDKNTCATVAENVDLPIKVENDCPKNLSKITQR